MQKNENTRNEWRRGANDDDDDGWSWEEKKNKRKARKTKEKAGPEVPAGKWSTRKKKNEKWWVTVRRMMTNESRDAQIQDDLTTECEITKVMPKKNQENQSDQNNVMKLMQNKIHNAQKKESKINKMIDMHNSKFDNAKTTIKQIKKK